MRCLCDLPPKTLGGLRPLPVIVAILPYLTLYVAFGKLVLSLLKLSGENKIIVKPVYPDEYELTYRLLLSEAKEKCDCKFVLVERHGSSLPVGARLERATMVGCSRTVRKFSHVEKFFITVDSVRTRTKKHLRKIDAKKLRIWSLQVIVFLLICRY